MNSETMTIEYGHLIRAVVPRRGKPYQHACSLASFREVCHTIDERAGVPFTGEDLVTLTDLPSTQVFTALAFLRERSIVESARGRKNAVSTIFDVFLDGMTEWHALEVGA